MEAQHHHHNHHHHHHHQQQQQPPLQPPAQPAAAKWIQDNEDSDNDQVGLVPHNRGYKHILFFFYILLLITQTIRII